MQPPAIFSIFYKISILALGMVMYACVPEIQDYPLLTGALTIEDQLEKQETVSLKKNIITQLLIMSQKKGGLRRWHGW